MLLLQQPEIYKAGDKVYVKEVRRVDPDPYKIYTSLGDGQYQLSRHGRIESKIFGMESLTTKPPP